MIMRYSTICLVAAIICFIAGAAIFMLALFARMFDPEPAGAVGAVLIMAFLFLSIANIAFRNRKGRKRRKSEGRRGRKWDVG